MKFHIIDIRALGLDLLLNVKRMLNVMYQATLYCVF